MRIDTVYVISSITVQRLFNTKMQATDYKKILFNYDFKVEAILDIDNMYLLEKNEVSERNRLSMDEGDKEVQDLSNQIINDNNLSHEE